MLTFVHFIVSYKDAVEYMNRHRNIEPAVYNDARLVEKPIPVTQPRLVDNTSDNNGTIEEDLLDNFSTSHDGNESPGSTSFESENTNKKTDQTEQKLSNQQLGLHIANNNDILNLIGEDDDVEIISFEDEEMEMTIGSKGFPKPMILMNDKRIKRENDEISGSEPYYETVSINTNHNFHNSS